MAERRIRAFRHVTFVIGLAITLGLVATAVVSLFYTPRDPLAMSRAGRVAGPVIGAPARDRSVRARPALAGDAGGHHLDSSGRDRGRHRHGGRRALRHPFRLFRRLARRKVYSPGTRRAGGP